MVVSNFRKYKKLNQRCVSNFPNEISKVYLLPHSPVAAIADLKHTCCTNHTNQTTPTQTYYSNQTMPIQAYCTNQTTLAQTCRKCGLLQGSDCRTNCIFKIPYGKLDTHFLLSFFIFPGVSNYHKIITDPEITEKGE